ncbi:methylenetetrahydrofolate reductase [Citricoccus sp. SGAir0253]|uniref:methylenetetrahydrofolate reductase n=1 Tax=Citricoccus sp. SGAir0253 TaxID=2567881 RepID=UPI0010CD6986|nr:methylenetetrahydrofolate reductase [Citricoccus sp. SGAir0253]QCU79242.1 methylenetetrahydrofolate reductase [Citricoccus sp. SGAir0253]
MNTTPATGRQTVMTEPSLEMTGKDKDIESLREAAPAIPQGTRINVTFLGNEDLSMRVKASTAARDLGFVPVPHISARRLTSRAELEEFLTALREQVGATHAFSVGGDPSEPMGPYASSLDVIQTGLFKDHGFTDVSIAGYPEGHPDISEGQLWDALERKNASLKEQGLNGTILTQFGFDVDPIVHWIEEVRRRGVDLPIRVGVPGPAGIKRLLTYASRFGVSTSAGIAKKYGFSLTNLLGTAGPDKLITALDQAMTPAHGDVKLHFYTFGGMRATAEWIAEYQRKH